MSVKITSFEAENVKRIQAVELGFSPNGLTVIGGGNTQGKSSILSAIAWGLGGDKLRPTKPNRIDSEDGEQEAYTSILLDNGIEVTRSGKRGTLKVVDKNGMKGGQSLLDNLFPKFALVLSKFMDQTPADKAKTILDIIGVKDELEAIDEKHAKAFSERRDAKRDLKQKEAQSEGMTFTDGLGDEPISITQKMAELEEIREHNASVSALDSDLCDSQESLDILKGEILESEAELEKLNMRLVAREEALKQTRELFDAAETKDEEALIAEIDTLDVTNDQIRENQRCEEVRKEVKASQKKVRDLEKAVSDSVDERQALLDKADLPLPGLNVVEGILEYEGQEWDCMSSAQQLKVATAIVRKLNPECGLVLVDKLEQFDLDQLKEFAEWAAAEELQVIGTRVSTGDECSVIIEDGNVATQEGESKDA